MAVDVQSVPGGVPATGGTIVLGEVVIASDYFKTFVAWLRKLFGGELRTYETMMSRARREAKLRMLEQADDFGAELVVNTRRQRQIRVVRRRPTDAERRDSLLRHRDPRLSAASRKVPPRRRPHRVLTVPTVESTPHTGGLMARYIMLYKGEATDVADMSEEQGNAVMAKWGAWMERIGPALSDVGAPFGPSGSLVDDGSTGQATGLTGYSIVEAENLGAA